MRAMSTPAERGGPGPVRLGLLWATVLATTAAAIAAAVVAWHADLGQEQARLAEALVVPPAPSSAP